MKSFLVTASFWAGAAERAAKSFSYALTAALGVPSVGTAVGLDVIHVGWQDALSFGAGGALLSLLGSIISAKSSLGPDGSASLVDDRP